MAVVDHKDNPLSISWHDSAWIPVLNPSNVMDYFSERTNPFYDRTCNNEVIKMQRLGPEHLGNMIGLEYCLLHVQEPILYVIRKQHRHSPTQVTPIADYYILAGTVYQAPDVGSVIGSRILSVVHQMQSAFEEASMYARYHPSKGYWWEFKDSDTSDKSKTKDKAKDERGTLFQRKRVDVLLAELARKFPPKVPSPPQLQKQTEEAAKPEAPVKVEVKQEKIEPPPPPTTTSATIAPPTTVATTVTATIASTTTTTTPVLPPPPPSVPQRTSMKPPPEKKPRLA